MTIASMLLKYFPSASYQSQILLMEIVLITMAVVVGFLALEPGEILDRSKKSMDLLSVSIFVIRDKKQLPVYWRMIWLTK